MFDSPFFARFPQHPSSFVDDDGERREYQFPSFYAGSRAMMLIYACSFEKARAALPEKRLLPVPAGFGKAAAMVAAFEFNHPQGLDPYLEVMFGIPALVRRPARLPAFGIFVKRLIVNRPENVQRGRHLWGMDKRLGELEFFDQGDFRVCEVHRYGRRALRLEVPRTGKGRQVDETRWLVTEKDGHLLLSQSALSGRKIERRGEGSLIAGPDPFAVEIESLALSRRPLFCRYFPALEQAMSLPAESIPL